MLQAFLTNSWRMKNILQRNFLQIKAGSIKVNKELKFTWLWSTASTNIQGSINICLWVCINYPKQILIIRMKHGDLGDAQQNFHHSWWEQLASHKQSKDILLADNASQDSEIIQTFIHHSDRPITFKRFCEHEAFHDLEI